MSTRTRKAVSGAFTSLMQLFVVLVLQVSLAPIVLLNAGKDVLGAYTIIMQIIGYGLIIDFGLGAAISRYLAQNFNSPGNVGKFKDIFNVGRFFLLASNILLSSFIVVLALNLEKLITDSTAIISEAKIAMYILSAWILVKTPLAIYSYGLLATQNMSVVNITGLFGSILRLILSVGFVYSGLGLVGLVIGNILAEFVNLQLQKRYYNKLHPDLTTHWYTPNLILLKEIFLFGITYWGVNISVVLTVGSDSIIIGYLYGAGAAAIFYTTKAPTFLLIQFIYKIADNAAPAANELLAMGNFASLKVAYFKILRYSLLVALPSAIGIIAFNEEVITVWVGRDQFAGDIMSYALAAFLVTQVVNHVNAMIALAAGNMRSWMMISLITGILCALLGYILARNLGFPWIMLGIAVMDIPIFLFLTRRSFVILDLKIVELVKEVITPVSLVAAPLLVVVTLFTNFFKVQDVSQLILYISGFLLLWLVGVYTLGINENERNSIKKYYNLSKRF